MTHRVETSADSKQQASDIERRLREFADPARAQNEKRYLKSPLVHLGVRVPQVRSTVRTWCRQTAATQGEPLTHVQLWALTDELWASPIYELRLAAVVLLSHQPGPLIPTDLARLRIMIAETFTWALVDPLSTDVVHSIIIRMAEPQIDLVLDEWSCDGSFWVRRASMLSQLRTLRRPDSDPTRFFRYADSMLDETEFFIRKAIGWILRDMSKTRADLVYAWLVPRAPRCSGVTAREAVKYLSPQQRAHIQQLRAPRSASRTTAQN